MNINANPTGLVTQTSWNLGRSAHGSAANLGSLEKYMRMVAPVSDDTWITIHHRVWSDQKNEYIFPGNAHQTIAAAMKDAEYWTRKGNCVYISMGMYRNSGVAVYPDGKPRPHPAADRTYQNLIACRNLYLDVDVKEDGGYLIADEMKLAVQRFLIGAKLPPPTVIVGSGNGGWHIYWTLDTPVDRAEHKTLAGRLVSAAVEHGLIFDRQCTVDATRLLRPPGTWNFKYATAVGVTPVVEATPVTLEYCGDIHVPIGVITKALSPWPVTLANPTGKSSHSSASAIAPGQVDAHGLPLDENSDLSGGMKKEYAPAKIDEVALHCPFIKNTLEAGGANLVGEPQWKNVISLACHTDTPSETAHRLSEKNQYYNREDTDQKLATAQQDRINNPHLGPPKCAYIAIEREECKTCPHLMYETTPLSVAFKVNATNTLAKRFAPPTASSAGEGVGLHDFVAFMQSGSYIFLPSGDHWPANRVDARVRGVPMIDTNGSPVLSRDGKKPVILKASDWIAQYAPADQMTWAPGRDQLIRDKMVSKGGWFDRVGMTVLNLYRPPMLTLGDASQAGPWIDHIVKVYPDDASHIIYTLAHRVQRPEEKINHGLVLGGHPGIGKDTILEPVKYAIGSWNFAEASPDNIVDKFNGYRQSVILRISEAKDLGDIDRYKFYERTKLILAAPPDVLPLNEKNTKEYYIENILFAIMTTNHKTNGIYLPADDRRHYVAWSEAKPTDFAEGYWETIWQWYLNGGIGHVAAYLAQVDLAAFNPKASPLKTDAFWAIVDAHTAPENAELADVFDRMGDPDATTLEAIITAAKGSSGSADSLGVWLGERKNRAAIPHRLEKCGYVPVRNPNTADGLYVIKGKRQTVYAKSSLPPRDRFVAVDAMIKAIDDAAKANVVNLGAQNKAPAKAASK